MRKPDGIDWAGMAFMSNFQSTKELQSRLERLQAGDEAARTELLGCACERLRKLTRKMLRDYSRLRRWEDSDDVVQNASMRLCRALVEVTPRNLRDFFRLAALHIRRELIDLARHYYGPNGLGANHASQGPESDSHGGNRPAYEPVDDDCDPSHLAVWSEFHQKIDALPAEEREVFDLLWYQGLTQGEAAEVLGVSERTIKRRWQAARLRLHEALNGESPKY